MSLTSEEWEISQAFKARIASGCSIFWIGVVLSYVVLSESGVLMELSSAVVALQK